MIYFQHWIHSALYHAEAKCNQKIDAAEDFKNAVQVVALTAGILPGGRAASTHVCGILVKRKRLAK